jgi:hypothetical protein
MSATSSVLEKRVPAGEYSKFLANRTLERCPARPGNFLSNSDHNSSAVTSDDKAISVESHFVASLSWAKNRMRTSLSCPVRAPDVKQTGAVLGNRYPIHERAKRVGSCPMPDNGRIEWFPA